MLQTIILALIQGLTEFLPVSSSAHLIILPKLLNWQDQGLLFDTVTHLGTLVALCAYFRHDLIGMVKTRNLQLAKAIFWGTIPVGLTGLLFHGVISTYARQTWIIGVSTIGFGLLLGVAGWRCNGQRTLQQLKWQDILLVGCAQALALIPGTSRSGITLTAGIFSGLNKDTATKYAFLLAIPVIGLASSLEIYKLLVKPIAYSGIVDWQQLVLGFIVALVSGYACIAVFLRLLKAIGLLPFVLYRLVLGMLLLLLFL